MRDFQRRAIDAYLDNYDCLTDEIVFDLLLAINDPDLRQWLIAQRRWERRIQAESS